MKSIKRAIVLVKKFKKVQKRVSSIEREKKNPHRKVSAVYHYYNYRWLV